MPANNRSCGTCEYRGEGSGAGYSCSRFPPVIIVLSNPYKELGQPPGLMKQYRPYVTDIDWCGEYKKDSVVLQIKKE